MKIYLISVSHFGCDCFDGFCIVANNESQVRELASDNAADEGSEIWKSSRASISEVGIFTGTATEPHVLIGSFNAG